VFQSVQSTYLYENLNVDLVEVLWDTEETSSKVLGSLNHTVLGLSAEDGESLLGGAVEIVSDIISCKADEKAHKLFKSSP
jgi:hypothetical protein